MRILIGSCYYGLVFRFPLLSTRGYSPDAVTFSYWPSSAGQVEDFHLAVKVRFQAHECPRSGGQRKLEKAKAALERGGEELQPHSSV